MSLPGDTTKSVNTAREIPLNVPEMSQVCLLPPVSAECIRAKWYRWLPSTEEQELRRVSFACISGTALGGIGACARQPPSKWLHATPRLRPLQGSMDGRGILFLRREHRGEVGRRDRLRPHATPFGVRNQRGHQATTTAARLMNTQKAKASRPISCRVPNRALT